MDAKKVIELLKLEPLPEEGGFYRQTYKSKGTLPSSLLIPNGKGTHHFSTAIYYLVTPKDFSALHRLPQDEIFHFYLGAPVEMIQIDDSGNLNTIVLGQRIDQGQSLQVLAPANIWQGTRLLPGGSWALLGTTVSPGFEFADFVVGSRKELIRQFPQHTAKITEYTHK